MLSTRKKNTVKIKNSAEVAFAFAIGKSNKFCRSRRIEV